MAITAAERKRVVWAVVGAVVFGCANPPGPAPTPGPSAGEPTIQIGLLVGAASVAVGGDAAVVLTQPDGSRLLDLPAGEVWRATAVTGGIALSSGTGVTVNTVPEARLLPTDSTAALRVNGRPYRGTLSLLRDRGGVTVVNEHAKGDVAARGGASDLLLMMWGRIPVAQVEVFGDASLLERWSDGKL